MRKSARHFWTMISFRSMSPAQTDGIRQCGLQKSAEKYEELVPGIVDDLNNNKIKFADVPELKEALDQLNDMAQKGYFGDNYLSDEYTDLLDESGKRRIRNGP